MAIVTPLQTKEFFSGRWHGEGEFIPARALRWLHPKETIRYSCQTHLFGDSFWVIRDLLEFSSGPVIDRKMFVEQTAPDRLHWTADDMPFGADVVLREDGYSVTPYYLWSGHPGGRKWLVRCFDENVVDAEGRIHDTITIRYRGLRVATMSLLITVDREAT